MPTVTAGARTSARSGLCDIIPCSDDDEIPDKREPRRRQSEGPTGVSGFEQALAVFADGMPLPAVANPKHARGVVRNSGRTTARGDRPSCAMGLSQRTARARVMDNGFEAPNLGIQHALPVRCERKVPAPLVVFVGGRSFVRLHNQIELFELTK